MPDNGILPAPRLMIERSAWLFWRG